MNDFIDKYWPVARGCDLIKGGQEDVVACTVDFMNQHGIEAQYRKFMHYEIAGQVVGGFEKGFDWLVPLTRERASRLLVVATSATNWIALQRNSSDYQVDQSLAQRLSKALSTVSVSAFCQPDTIGKVHGRYVGIEGETLLDVVENGFTRRYLDCEHDVDDGWIFDSVGDPFPFEDLDRYRSPKKRDRFTPEMLVRYLKELGLSPFEEDFFRVTREQPAIGIRLIAEKGSPTLSKVAPPQYRREIEGPHGD